MDLSDFSGIGIVFAHVNDIHYQLQMQGGTSPSDSSSTGPTTCALSEVPVGKEARIVGLHGEHGLRLRLMELGLLCGTEVTVVRTAPLGDPIELLLRGYRLSIRIADASTVEVRV
ncbi:MAG: FeoA family protein [Polyangiales bacterium]